MTNLALKGLMILAALAGIYVGYHIGYWARDIEGDPKAALKSISTDIKIKEKQDEIRNNRPERDAVIKRLRAGTY